MVALSVSKVIKVSSTATVSPTFTATSMMSTLSCPPISGTFNSIKLMFSLSYTVIAVFQALEAACKHLQAALSVLQNHATEIGQ